MRGRGNPLRDDVIRIAIVEDEDIYADQLNKFIDKYAAEARPEFGTAMRLYRNMTVPMTLF